MATLTTAAVNACTNRRELAGLAREHGINDAGTEQGIRDRLTAAARSTPQTAAYAAPRDLAVAPKATPHNRVSAYLGEQGRVQSETTEQALARIFGAARTQGELDVLLDTCERLAVEAQGRIGGVETPSAPAVEPAPAVQPKPESAPVPHGWDSVATPAPKPEQVRAPLPTDEWLATASYRQVQKLGKPTVEALATRLGVEPGSHAGTTASRVREAAQRKTGLGVKPSSPAPAKMKPAPVTAGTILVADGQGGARPATLEEVYAALERLTAPQAA